MGDDGSSQMLASESFFQTLDVQGTAVAVAGVCDRNAMLLFPYQA